LKGALKEVEIIKKLKDSRNGSKFSYLDQPLKKTIL